MTDPGCQRYIEEPELSMEHVRTCKSCSRLAAGLEAPDQSLDLASRLGKTSLPVAPWEGARQRSWPLLASAALLIALIASVCFHFAGVSPLDGFEQTVRQSAAPPLLYSAFLHLGNSLHEAPLPIRVGLGIGFIVVNFLLALLLRKAPKGLDATSD